MGWQGVGKARVSTLLAVLTIPSIFRLVLHHSGDAKGAVRLVERSHRGFTKFPAPQGGLVRGAIGHSEAGDLQRRCGAATE